MDARSIIAKLRDGREPGQAELNWFARGLANGAVSDAQAGAFAMAAFKGGLTDEARVALTLAMRDSGDVMDWGDGAPVLDKHSTGGIGDCVSLLLAPMLAACGARVPMISGRGLGHTGGTLDKLEAIPGVSTSVDEATFRRITGEIGCAIVSATGDIAPADRRLYAVRDVTATVESIDLITASILSKKLAAGLEGLILDVKVGSGAFMATEDDARGLATALVETAKGAGCPTMALMTDMDQPLADAAGNAVEIAVVMEALTAPQNSRLVDLTLALGAELLVLGGMERDLQTAAEKLLAALTGGEARARFDRMIAALGGPSGFSEDWRARLPEAVIIRDIEAHEAGHVAAIDGVALGEAVVHLGGGRLTERDRIDPAVGLSHIAPLGTKLGKGDPMLRLHASTEAAAREAERRIRAAITLGDAPAPARLIRERIT